MKIALISDTHGMHDSMYHDLPKADVLIHAGDLTNVGSRSGTRQFVEWFQNLKGYDTKIFIAGNHDWSFYRKPTWLYDYINDENLSQSDCVYLEDSEFTIQSPEFSKPIKFYGSPWQPPFNNWAFNVPRDLLYKYWELIPHDTDVLITHTPPQGIRDYVDWSHLNEGCSSLRYYVEQIKPALHVFGHIHSGFGGMVKNDILFINASTATESYDMTNKPIVVELVETDGKIIANPIENE